ncbi:MAG: 4-alpha-glucanotransferase [Sphaerobacter sp.]|nr:4-alpha-glucanotransferase [Sphaerobacter sp.]
MARRRAGILLHPTSLPGDHGIGDLGEAAFRFLAWLSEAGQSLWQLLPLGPPGGGNSPYDARSSFAGSPLLIALAPLVELGLLAPEEVPPLLAGDPSRVDYAGAAAMKQPALRRACERFVTGSDPALRADYEAFCARAAAWLDDYALYAALRSAHDGLPWYRWEPELVRREPEALRPWRARLDREVHFEMFLQYLFDRQWGAVKRRANELHIEVVGDIPIYVAHDSADVWAHQEIFTLDEHGQPTRRAGVPPDYFSASGQLWGNPCYRWDVLAATEYRWWVERFRRARELFDVVRVDHFRGFVAGWQVPAGEDTALNGVWVPGPGEELFRRVEHDLGRVPLIVEDLGLITEDVHALRAQLGYPGMRVLQFAFGGGSDNPYLPHNYERNTVVYTGTHDNDTTLGWFRSCAPHEREHALRYLGTDGSDVAWDLIRLALMSIADTAIVPLQDVLELGSEARMNVPGTAAGNWEWRSVPDGLSGERARRLAVLTETYGRDARGG